MKKNILVIIFTIISTTILAQVIQISQDKSVENVSQSVLIPLTTAIDFSVTFTDGTSASLFTTCNAGNSVVLDFFFKDCHSCQVYAPIIEQAYVLHGSGTGNIKFWGIDTGDDNATVDAYKATYGVTNPCASGTQGGGDAVNNTYTSNYNWAGYPNYAVVCPDHTFYNGVNKFPTPSPTGFDYYFAQCGTLSVDENYNPLQAVITYMYPIPARDNLNVHIYIDKVSLIRIELFDILGNLMHSVTSSVDIGYYNAAVDVTNYTAGTYIIKLAQNDIVKDIQKIMVVK